jgi:hypothetical protein
VPPVAVTPLAVNALASNCTLPLLTLSVICNGVSVVVEYRHPPAPVCC